MNVGDKVTIGTGSQVWRITALRDERFPIGGVQQVAELRNARGEGSTSRVANLHPHEEEASS